MSFKVIPSNDSASGYSTREQQAMGTFFEGLQNCMESKNEGNENKIIL